MDTSADVAVIADLEDQRWAANISADVEALDRLLSDDLMYTHSNARLDTKASYLVLIPTVNYQSIDRPEREIRVFDNSAIVTGRADITIANSEGVIRNVSIRYTNVWIRTEGIWRFTAWQATPVTA